MAPKLETRGPFFVIALLWAAHSIRPDQLSITANCIRGITLYIVDLQACVAR